MRTDYYRVEELVRCKKRLWHGDNIVRIAKRKKHKSYYHSYYEYFVTKPGDPVGYGTWVHPKDLIALSPLERLALEAVDLDELDEKEGE